MSKAAKRSGEIRPEKMSTRFGDKLVTGHLGKGRLRGRGGPEQLQMGEQGGGGEGWRQGGWVKLVKKFDCKE